MLHQQYGKNIKVDYTEKRPPVFVLKKKTGDRHGSQSNIKVLPGSVRPAASGLDFQLDIYRKRVSSQPGRHFCQEFH